MHASHYRIHHTDAFHWWCAARDMRSAIFICILYCDTTLGLAPPWPTHRSCRRSCMDPMPSCMASVTSYTGPHTSLGRISLGNYYLQEPTWQFSATRSYSTSQSHWRMRLSFHRWRGQIDRIYTTPTTCSSHTSETDRQYQNGGQYEIPELTSWMYACSVSNYWWQNKIRHV